MKRLFSYLLILFLCPFLAKAQNLDVEGDAKIGGLGGNGTEMVVTDNDGNLSTQAIPGGGGSSVWSLNGLNAYYNDGRVGIGTDMPARLLNVHFNNANQNTSPFLISQAGIGDAFMNFGLTGGAHYALGIDNSDSNKFKIGYDATSPGGVAQSTFLTIENNGDVGIGTTTPNAQLQVHAFSNDNYPILDLEQLGNTDFARLRFSNSTLSQYWTIEGGSLNNFMNINYFNGVSSTDILSIDGEAEEVGVKTTNPLMDFDVNGDIALSDGDGSIGFYEGTTQKAELSYNGSSLLLSTGETNGDVNIQATEDIFLNPDNAILFRSGGFTRMFMNNTGDFGVGTTQPSAKVEVVHNNSTADPHLELTEFGDSDDFARIEFNNNGSSFWNLAGKSEFANPLFNIYYNNGSSGTNILTVDGDDERVIAATGKFRVSNLEIDALNSSTLGLDGDVVPFSNVEFDLGNNDASEHWDDAVCDDFVNFSDKRVKTNIKRLNYGLDELIKLEPISYRYTYESKNHKESLGFIAQDVLDIIPNVVKTHDIDKDEDGNWVIEEVEILGMNYVELIPVVVNSIKEQQEQIEKTTADNQALRQKVSELEQQNKALEARLTKLEQLLTQNTSTAPGNSSTQVVELNAAQLYQNEPNPFNQSTRIAYDIPNDVQSAALYITTADGKPIKQIPIAQRGSGQTILQAGTLPAGRYQYTLLLDGKITATKQMVLTK